MQLLWISRLVVGKHWDISCWVGALFHILIYVFTVQNNRLFEHSQSVLNINLFTDLIINLLVIILYRMHSLIFVYIFSWNIIFTCQMWFIHSFLKTVIVINFSKDKYIWTTITYLYDLFDILVTFEDKMPPHQSSLMFPSVDFWGSQEMGEGVPDFIA